MSNNTGIAHINKYLPFALVYLFFNSLFMPEGLLITTLLTPLFLYQLVREKHAMFLVGFVVFLSLFFCVHVVNGIHFIHYLKSYILFITVGIFTICMAAEFKKPIGLKRLFQTLLIVNAAFIPFAVLSLTTGIFRTHFWYDVPITPGEIEIPRLKMFTYEASYYSLMLTPLCFYFIWNFFMKPGIKSLLYLILIFIPLAMSFSLGVIAGIGISMIILILTHVRLIRNTPRLFRVVVWSVLLVIAILIVYYFINPDNVILTRIKNVFSGKDTSARGRTYESFDLAMGIVNRTSLWFGAGLGQIKDIGREVVMEYYKFNRMPEVARIPNAVAETFAVFGIIGLTVRFILILYLFIRTNVFQNYFRLSLFIFLFIYQFTGSFIFNIAEYAAWVLVFSPMVFREFNKTERINT